MPDREFIHSREDVRDALRFARSMGLQVLSDRTLGSRAPEPMSSEQIDGVDRGVFYLFRSEWVSAPLQVMHIDAGANAGTFVVKPDVNFAAITVYFQGEGVVEGTRRLGSGTISFKREWLHNAANEMRPVPIAVSNDYDALCKHLLHRDVVRAGVHRYRLARNASRLASTESTRPPFDFIPWPPPNQTQHGSDS